MILYIEILKKSLKKLLEVINKLNKVVDTRQLYKSQCFFYTLKMNIPKLKLREQFCLQ